MMKTRIRSSDSSRVVINSLRVIRSGQRIAIKGGKYNFNALTLWLFYGRTVYVDRCCFYAELCFLFFSFLKFRLLVSQSLTLLRRTKTAFLNQPVLPLFVLKNMTAGGQAVTTKTTTSDGGPPIAQFSHVIIQPIFCLGQWPVIWATRLPHPNWKKLCTKNYPCTGK